MNYPQRYLKNKQEDLAEAAFDLLYHPEVRISDKSTFTEHIDRFSAEYRKHLLRGRNLTRLRRSLIPILSDNYHETCVWVVYQRLYFIYNYLTKHELYEVLGNFWQINNKLAKAITDIRPLDVTPIQSEENFLKFIDELDMEIAKYLFNNGLTHLLNN